MKCALVTGGSRGIGRSICQKLAEELNYHVLINYQGNKDAALETLELLEATGATGEILQFNVADIQETQATLQNWSVRNPEAVVEVIRSEEHTSELQSRENLVCRLLLEKKNKNK